MIELYLVYCTLLQNLKKKGSFKMNEKVCVLLGTLGTIILGVLGPLIAWFGGANVLSGNNKEIVRQMFNFEISLCIVGLLSIIPFVGFIVAPVVLIMNLIFAVKAFLASNKNEVFKAPGYEFVK